jgi:hypothetical protein
VHGRSLAGAAMTRRIKVSRLTGFTTMAVHQSGFPCQSRINWI